MIIEGKGVPNAIANKGPYIIKSTLIFLDLIVNKRHKETFFFLNFFFLKIEFLVWPGFKWWEGLDVDLSMKRIIPNKAISKAWLINYEHKW